jgi:RNA polymerase-binding transcription factor DksA
MAPARKTTKAAPSAKKSSPAKAPAKAASKSAKPPTKAPAKRAAGARAKPPTRARSRTKAKAPAAKKSARSKQAAVTTTTTPTKTSPKSTSKTTTKKASKAPSKPATKSPAPTVPPPSVNNDGGLHLDVPSPRGVTKDGVAYTKDFDAKFLKAQRAMLTAERLALVGQADRLEDEANSLIEEGEMGDVQFDDESGEGDTMVVERERDLALSAQARQIVADIDAALARIASGKYGYSLVSGRPIPRERLEAIPWATELVEEKVGGIGRR